MSAIDDYIEHMTKHAPGHATLTIDARDEISRLRSEVDILRATAAEAATLRAELETLRNDHIVLMNDRNVTQAENDDLRATVTEQAQTIETAREAIAESQGALIGAGLGGCYAEQACRAWLAANAQAQDETESEK